MYRHKSPSADDGGLPHLQAVWYECVSTYADVTDRGYSFVNETVACHKHDPSPHAQVGRLLYGGGGIYNAREESARLDAWRYISCMKWQVSSGQGVEHI